MEKEVNNAKETWFSYGATITYLWLAGKEGMESSMEHIFSRDYTGTIIRSILFLFNQR